MPTRRPAPADRHQTGFTLVEVLAAVSLVALAVGIAASNLGLFVPSARLDGSGRELRAKLAELRSEARIQAARIGIELDLDKARWREIYPPEERLTSDQYIVADEDLTEDEKDWTYLEDDVVFAGAGDARGFAEKGIYRLMFDEYGFTADQVVALQLESDETMIWSLSVQGLTGLVETQRSETGEMMRPYVIDEGAF